MNLGGALATRGLFRGRSYDGWSCAYGKFPVALDQRRLSSRKGGRLFPRADDEPTLDAASVSEFIVLDFPALGLPTRPMRVSRAILEDAVESEAGWLEEPRCWWNRCSGRSRDRVHFPRRDQQVSKSITWQFGKSSSKSRTRRRKW